MSLNQIKALTFDTGGTILDWHSGFSTAFKIAGDEVRVFGDRFIKCESSNGITVNISAERTNETLNPGDPYAHYGLEHFGITVKDIDLEIDRLLELGAELLEGPIPISNGIIESIAFIKAPGDTRIELIQFS